MKFLPGYLQLHQQGGLAKRAAQAKHQLKHCMLCPRQCGVNRQEEETGLCQTGSLARVASYGPHFGEEQPLVGDHGSGTIFFAGCNLLCCFCQNRDISHKVEDCSPVTAEQLAEIMLELQHTGCGNINLVTPTHVVPQILQALVLAAGKGLNLPLVYNTSSYEHPSTLQLLEGVIDIYMPDIKFWQPATASRYAKATDYPQRAQQALQIMYHQVGNLQLDEHGSAHKGLLVRHLLMPGLSEETEALLQFLAGTTGPETYLNIMDQYHPCGPLSAYPELQHRIPPSTYAQAIDLAHQYGLHRLDQPDLLQLLKRMQVHQENE